MHFSKNRNNRKENRRILWLVLCAALLLFSSCSKKETPEVTAEDAEAGKITVDNRYYYSDENQAAYDLLQSGMEEEGKGLAVAYLGRSEELASLLRSEEPDHAAADILLSRILGESGLTEEWPFLGIIHSYRVLPAGEGNCLYVVIPDQASKGLVISRVREEESGNSKGETLAEASGAYPLLILTDKAWIGENGGRGASVAISGDTFSSDGVLELNRYSRPVSGTELTGTWVAAGVKDGADSSYDLYLRFDGKGGVQYWYQYSGAEGTDGNSAGPGERALLHYTGTLEEQGDNRFVFDLVSDGGVFADAGAPETGFRGVFRLSFKDEAGTALTAANISGDPLPPEIRKEELRFVPAGEADGAIAGTEK